MPFYRPEAVVYAGLPGLARFIGLEILGTFHERQGEQSLLTKNGGFPIAWGRAFGSKTEFRRGGPLAPEFDGHLFGFQAGMDVGAAETWQGHRDHFGLFVGHAEADGDVRGFALGQRRLASGSVPMDATSLGLYWTHVGPQGWYLDGVLMHSWLDGEPRSNRGVGLDLEGHATTASLEGGYPIWLTDKISLEPQAQIIWQHVAFDPTQDRFSSVSFDADDAWTGRIGARLQGTFQDGSTTWRPYLKVNLWHGFDATDRTQFSNVVAAGLVRGDLARGRSRRGGDPVGECEPVRRRRLHDQPQWTAPRDDRRQSRHADHMVSGPIREDPDRFRRVAERARMTDIEM